MDLKGSIGGHVLRYRTSETLDHAGGVTGLASNHLSNLREEGQQEKTREIQLLTGLMLV